MFGVRFLMFDGAIMKQRIRGVLAPVVTPFKADLSPDSQRFIAHCKWLLSQNCGLAVFGTTSEANSLSMEERAMLLDELVAAGVDPSRIMPGTGCCSIMETVKLTKQAVGNGCAGVLMLPPFYYKDVSEEGLYRYFSEVVQRVGDARLKIYLYHIPPVALQLPVRLALSMFSLAANHSCSPICGTMASVPFPRPPTLTRLLFTPSSLKLRRDKKLDLPRVRDEQQASTKAGSFRLR